MSEVKFIIGSPGGKTVYPKCMILKKMLSQSEKKDVVVSILNEEEVYVYLPENISSRDDVSKYVLPENKAGILLSSMVEGLSTKNDVVKTLRKAKNLTLLGSMYSINAVTFVELSDVDISSLVKDKDILDSVKTVTSKGIVSESVLWERIGYLVENNVPKHSIIKILSTYRDYPSEVKGLISSPKTLFIDSGTTIVECVAYINCGANLLFEGERGTGKNVLTETLSWIYHRPLFEFATNSQHDNSSCLGSKTFKDSSSDLTPEKAKDSFKKLSNVFSKFFSGGVKKIFTGKEDDSYEVMETLRTAVKMTTGSPEITFEPSTIIKSAIYGGILVMDEVNTAIGHTISVFNGLFDDRRRISVEGFRDVSGDSNFFVIATMNKDYRATFKLNEAFDDRFERIVFESPESIAGILKTKVPEVDDSVVKKCDLIYSKLLDSIRVGEIDSKSLTIRGFIKVAQVVTYEKLSLSTALKISIVNKVEDEDEKHAVMSFVEMLG